jgi:acetoin utilization deacetylase AcuC-like enzyme
VGEVPQGTLSTPLVQGFNLVASQVPQAGALSGALGYTAAEGDQVYQFNVATQQYASSTYELGAWGPSDPAIGVGEGFFLSKGAAGTWTREFDVSP